MMVVLTAQSWGRRSQSLGRKGVLVAALALATTMTAAFAVISQLSIVGALGGSLLFVLFVGLRSIGFGTAIAAIQPTAQAYIADITTDEAQRVRGMAGIGAVQGIAHVTGAIAGGLLAALGLMVPLIAVPVLLALGVVLVVVWMGKEDGTTLIEEPVRVRPTGPRVWPFLVAGFGMFTALGFVQIITGFIVQDRLRVDAETAGVLTGAALLSAGVGLILAQAVIVPKSGLGPGALLRVGCPIALVGFLALIPDAGPIALFGSVGLIGLGLGTAMPGYTAGPTVLVSREEQGGLAGLIAANMGLTFVLAPTLATMMYGEWSPLPVVVGAAIMAAVSLFVLSHPRFRRLSAHGGGGTESVTARVDDLR